MLVIIISQVATPANITNFKKGEIIKTTPFEIVLIIRDIMGSVLVIIVLALIIGAVIFNMIKQKKQGKGGCSCGCGGCGMSDICHGKQEEE